MTVEDPAEQDMVELVRALPPDDVSARRAARLRSYCHLQLAREARVGQPAPHPWIPAGLTVTGVLYAIAIVVRALAGSG